MDVHSARRALDRFEVRRTRGRSEPIGDETPGFLGDFHHSRAPAAAATIRAKLPSMRAVLAPFVVLACVACDRPAPPVVSADKGIDATTPTAATPTPHPSVSISSSISTSGIVPDAVVDAAFALPAVDDTCATDADCTTTTDSISGTYVCCPGCTTTVANVRWIKAMKTACASHPPSVCPPLGCAVALPNPKCVTGHCIDEK